MPISLSSSRNDLVERALSRIRVSLCWTRGCSTTVTPSMTCLRVLGSENRAVADDGERRRAVRAKLAGNLPSGGPGAALQDLGKRQGFRIHAQSLPHDV